MGLASQQSFYNNNNKSGLAQVAWPGVTKVAGLPGPTSVALSPHPPVLLWNPLPHWLNSCTVLWSWGHGCDALLQQFLLEVVGKEVPGGRGQTEGRCQVLRPAQWNKQGTGV